MGDMRELDFDQQLVKDLAIPPRPQVVSVLFEEMSRDEPDLQRVAKQVAADVGLSGAMLKAVNSVQFGLGRKISSVPQAITLMGFKNVANVATALVIKNSINGGGPSLNSFWESAEQVALLCARLARQFRGIAADEAYTFGLFHDVGIPLILRRFPGYQDEMGKTRDVEGVGYTAREESAFNTNHASVGYLLARSWGLSDIHCEAIRRHHEVTLFDTADPIRDLELLNLVALAHLAERIFSLGGCDGDDSDWDRFEESVTRHFGLSEDDMLDLVEEFVA